MPRVLLVACVVFSSGCAGLIAQSGTDLTRLATKEEVHAEFGEPVSSGVVDDQHTEEFFTHQKINTFDYDYRTIGIFNGYGRNFILTLGLSELYNVPKELCLMCSRRVIGQSIQVMYNEDGFVTNILHNGNSRIYWLINDRWAKRDAKEGEEGHRQEPDKANHPTSASDQEENSENR